MGMTEITLPFRRKRKVTVKGKTGNCFTFRD